MDSNEINETNDQIINNEELIILPIPVSLSQLMGSFMNNNIYTTTTNITTTNTQNNLTEEELNINETEINEDIVADNSENTILPDNSENTILPDNSGNNILPDNSDNTILQNDNHVLPNDNHVLPYENIQQPNLFMNIFTRNLIPAQGLSHDPPQTFEEQIVNQTFNQQNKYKKVCSKDFINSLSVQKVTKEMVEKKITCGVCLDELKEGEEILELPCKDKHYFHIKNDICDGIYPWLKDNNTCPLCRHEFPSDEKEIEDQTTVEPIRPVLRPINLMELVNQALQDEEERILQQTILESLNDTNQENNNDSI